jgi:hypothetical protein
MTEHEFPPLEALGRPANILETAISQPKGIILLSEYEDAGIPFTLTALGHDLKNREKHVLYVGFSQQEPLPGIDSLLIPEMNEEIYDHLIGEGLPDVAIFESINDPSLAYLSYVLASKGVCVIVSIFASSTEDALDKYTSIMPDVSSKGYSRYLVNLAVHHSYDIHSSIPWSVNRFQIREAEKQAIRYFNEMDMKRCKNQTPNYNIIGYQVTTKLY